MQQGIWCAIFDHISVWAFLRIYTPQALGEYHGFSCIIYQEILSIWSTVNIDLGRYFFLDNNLFNRIHVV